ncbi:MAG: CRISPR system precrRNA processing endoribonuclease RAMP protein Cas6 [Actinomycetaceae bacterium]|nr:CRISPR system precrRNA processing endoribonuclease RAMP protein Cas6 [Actinomycetaceae bacterium]
MPATYLIPLLDITEPVNPTYSRAAFTSLMDDGRAEWSHKPDAKPYTISQAFLDEDGWVGIEVSVLTDAAEEQLFEGVARSGQLRLGRNFTRVATPLLQESAAWEELASLRQRRWTIELFTPTTFRHRSDRILAPHAGIILRAAAEAWQLFSPVELEPLAHDDAHAISIDSSGATQIKVSLPPPSRLRKIPSLVGTLSFECHDEAVAAKVAPLFNLMSFTGVGSHRNLGFGLTRLISAE